MNEPWNDTVCIHHNDKERAEAFGNCPVCLKSRAEKAEREAEQLSKMVETAQQAALVWEKDLNDTLARCFDETKNLADQLKTLREDVKPLLKHFPASSGWLDDFLSKHPELK